MHSVPTDTEMTTMYSADTWTLAEFQEEGDSRRCFALQSSKATVGRSTDATFTVPAGDVSKKHAVIEVVNDRPVVSDLGSTNGTFVNGRRVTEAPLTDGDLVQFASALFRVCRPQPVVACATQIGSSHSLAKSLMQFEQLMAGGNIIPHFQPIIRLHDEECIGYELLARSDLNALKNPDSMFSTAAFLNQECALSDLMRREGIRDAFRLPECRNLFVNTHPKEMVQEAFLNSLYDLRQLAGDLPITIEVHEASVTNSEGMAQFRQVLADWV